MSKKSSKRRRQQQGYALPDVRRDYLMHLERRGRLQTTPREWVVREPFYLPELGLTRECWQTCPARGELPPIIHTREAPVLEVATVG